MNIVLLTVTVIFLSIPVAALTLAVSRVGRADTRVRSLGLAADEALRASRARALLGLASALMTMVVCVLSPAMRGSLGVLLALALAPSLSASVGLLMYALIPVTPDAGTENVRYASLQPRHPWSFVTTGQFIGLGATTTVLLALLIGAGITASADDMGRPSRSFSITVGDIGSAAGPYPGWYYGIPMLAGTLVLAGSALLALRRVVTTPALPGPGLESQNRHWNRVSTHVIVNVVQATLLLQIAGVAGIAGTALKNVASGMLDLDHVGTIGYALMLMAAIAILGSGTLAILAAIRALTLPSSVR